MKPAARDTRAGWLSHPVLSLMLAAAWLFLQQSLALPQLITAAVLGLGVPRLVFGFLGPGVRLRSIGTVLRFSGTVLHDIAVANLTVARIVMNPMADPQPAWVPVPLELTHSEAITLMASIITLTPGTVSCVVDEERRLILVHALDCDDPAALAAEIKQRYEVPLREIFE
jgi:multicomponent K+:H+ antiporter subunit E